MDLQAQVDHPCHKWWICSKTFLATRFTDNHKCNNSKWICCLKGRWRHHRQLREIVLPVMIKKWNNAKRSRNMKILLWMIVMRWKWKRLTWITIMITIRWIYNAKTHSAIHLHRTLSVNNAKQSSPTKPSVNLKRPKSSQSHSTTSPSCPITSVNQKIWWSKVSSGVTMLTS